MLKAIGRVLVTQHTKHLSKAEMPSAVSDKCQFAVPSVATHSIIWGPAKEIKPLANVRVDIWFKNSGETVEY